MNEEIIEISDLDLIFLTYDEPKKEEFWIKIQNMIPWAKRVDGVKGSDAAHKAAAAASDTERFILVDGDNIPDAEFFNQQLILTERFKDCVFRWKAKNNINGLMYGNGGISCWTRQFIFDMKTHENTDGRDESLVEFCFEPKYIAMHDCYSTTYPNGTAFQAWRAGFREGVKMCLDRGRRPSLDEFEQSVHKRNYDHLCIWQSIGSDVDNGSWAILGARAGTYRTMLTDWDYKQVQDFECLATLWNEYKNLNLNEAVKEHGTVLRTRLGLPITDFDTEQSLFFKTHYKTTQRNRGIMVTESDALRHYQ
jgi:hypothetical protein